MAEKKTETDPATPAEEPTPAPAEEPESAPADEPEDDPESEPASSTKEKNRQGFESRQLQKRLDALEKENQGYKRREEDTRKAKLSEDERLREERDELARKVTTLETEKLQAKIGAEFKLPPALSALLIGTDEEGLRAHAEELAKLLPRAKVGTTTDPLREQGTKRIYTRAELAADPKLARSAEVKQAALEGRVQ